MSEPTRGLSRRQAVTKRALDLALTLVSSLLWLPAVLVAAIAARFDTGSTGIFRQQRVGRDGELFEVLKVRTMRTQSVNTSTVTTSTDTRITPLGAIFRRLKIDELPQLLNVIKGEMSLVGPRPDVPGFADRLVGEDRIILTLRPGVTGPAALAYRHEQDLLAAVPDPESYNDEVIWPDKVRINREYVENYSLASDLRCLTQTVLSVFQKSDDEVKQMEKS